MAKGSRGKAGKGHWAKRAMPARIPDAPENVARAFAERPAEKAGGVGTPAETAAGGGQGWLENASFRLVYNSLIYDQTYARDNEWNSRGWDAFNQ